RAIAAARAGEIAGRAVRSQRREELAQASLRRSPRVADPALFQSRPVAECASLPQRASTHSTMESGMDELLPRRDSWSRWLRVLFRFGFCFLVLVLFPFPVGDAPGNVVHTTFYSRMWFGIADRFGTRFLHAPPTPEQFSEYMLADTAAGWTTLLLCVLLAMAATVAWTILDRERR